MDYIGFIFEMNNIISELLRNLKIKKNSENIYY